MKATARVAPVGTVAYFFGIIGSMMYHGNETASWTSLWHDILPDALWITPLAAGVVGLFLAALLGIFHVIFWAWDL